MHILSAIAAYTLKQHLRQKVYLALLVFGFLLFGGAMAVSPLAAEERLRLLIDLGLAGIEFIALFAMVFLTVGLVLEEMESRTISLILAHPVPRPAYVLGRYLGTLGAVAFGMLVMAAAHAALLLAFGWRFAGFYPVAWLAILGKIALVGALALLLSLFSSSAATAMAFTAFVWVLGHFSEEMAYLGLKSGSAVVKVLALTACELVPDLSVFGFRDLIRGALPPASWYAWAVLYCAGYTGVCLLCSCLLMARKEF